MCVLTVWLPLYPGTFTLLAFTVRVTTKTNEEVELQSQDPAEDKWYSAADDPSVLMNSEAVEATDKDEKEPPESNGNYIHMYHL